MDEKHKVLAIIVTYNGMEWLERCLNSVTRTSTTPLDVFVVDNGSSDGSAEFIEQNYPEVILTKSPTNLGFGAANNLGLLYAIEKNYDYAYLLNQDAWIMPNAISTMIECQRKEPAFGVISPMQLDAQMQAPASFARHIRRAIAKNGEGGNQPFSKGNRD